MCELELLSDEELYYIRNGILAYAGRAFEPGYYDKYSWYSENLSKEDVWSNINQFQLENIENIKSVERQRDECID
ncbi:MAG: YARHG domain-containing protein [Butyrivibrio sp.]|nr:YARHG domain-containing protein [Butyrivibrio sp.]